MTGEKLNASAGAASHTGTQHMHRGSISRNSGQGNRPSSPAPRSADSRSVGCVSERKMRCGLGARKRCGALTGWSNESPALSMSDQILRSSARWRWRWHRPGARAQASGREQGTQGTRGPRYRHLAFVRLAFLTLARLTTRATSYLALVLYRPQIAPCLPPPSPRPAHHTP